VQESAPKKCDILQKVRLKSVVFLQKVRLKSVKPRYTLHPRSGPINELMS
jgi:hypothetical protein